MAHELDMSNGQANMAYVGELPWHGLGQQLTPEADIETWKKEAGLDWMIQDGSILLTRDGHSDLVQFPGKKGLYRSDTREPLSIVGADYNVVQPGEVLDFYADLVGAAGFQLETAGSLFNGRKFWALARTGKDVRIFGQDVVSPYLMIASSCDGTMATVAHFTTVRVVCNNTLRMAVGSDGKKAKMRIPHSTVFDHDKVKYDLGIGCELWEEFIDHADVLARYKLHRDDAIDLVAAHLKSEWHDPAESDMDRLDRLDSSKALRRIIQLFDGDAMGAEYRSSRSTAWGLLNAVTEYYDHEVGRTEDRSNAFDRTNLGELAGDKVKFANELIALAA